MIMVESIEDTIVDSERVADAKGDMDGLQNILRHYFVCDDAGVYG